jgi:hypothetical protein
LASARLGGTGPTATSQVRARCLNTAPLTRSPGLDINEEWLDFGRDADVVEEEVRGGVAAP